MYKLELEREVYNALLSDLKSCTIKKSLQWGKKLHAQAVESHNDSNRYVIATLMKMYASCGSMLEARQMFDSIPKPDVVTWNILLLGYADNGNELETLDLFAKMKQQCMPNSVSYVAALKACTTFAGKVDERKRDCLEWGSKIHWEISCQNMNFYVHSTLINMYAKCGNILEAQRVFDGIEKPVLVSWNVLIRGYAENGDGLASLELLSQMRARGCEPDSVTYIFALKACTCLALNGDNLNCLQRGREIHSQIGSLLDFYLESSLIEMYAKGGSMIDARHVFDRIRKPDVVCWNTLLIGYAENGEEIAALDLFSRMKASGCLPDSISYVAVLKACTSLAVVRDMSANEDCLEFGRRIHSEVGSHLDHILQNKLIDMYSSCGCMIDARCVFDNIRNPDVISWTALLLGYAENGEGHLALKMFSNMKARGCTPNSVTYIAALKACGLTGALNLGRKLHFDISEITAPVVTCLVDFYAKCGSMVEARRVFDLHSEIRGVPAWNALLAGYSSFVDTNSISNIFYAMRREGLLPDSITFGSMLLGYSHAGLIERAIDYFNAMSVQYGVAPTVMHYTCMVDVLGRANQLNEAVSMLRAMPCKPDAVTWTAVLGACRKWKNVEIGRMAFQSLVSMDENDASTHILMGHIYGSKGMWEEQKKVFQRVREINSLKQTLIT